jgi:hypothetical protein
LEEDIDGMVRSVTELLEFEDAELFPLIDRLAEADTEDLRRAVDAAGDHQTSLPDPPDNGLLRKLAEVREAVGLSLNDESTPWHPGTDALVDPSP